MCRKISETEFIVDGAMPLLDFSRQFLMVPKSTDVVTVSGYVIHILGRVPERGTSVRIGQWVGIVEAVDGFKIKSLRLRKAAADIHAEGADRMRIMRKATPVLAACAMLTVIAHAQYEMPREYTLQEARYISAGAMVRDFAPRAGYTGGDSLAIAFTSWMPMIGYHQGRWMRSSGTRGIL